MAQVVIRGHREALAPRRRAVSDASTETPKANRGIRGTNAADLALGYRVEV